MRPEYFAMKNALFTLTSLMILFSACKKSDSGSSGNRSILTSGRWRITSSIAVIEYPSPIGTQTADVLSTLPTCQRDNLYIFNGDGTATADEGATKCNSGDPQQKSAGNWSLLNNDTQIRTYDNNSGVDIAADILTLDNSILTVRYITSINSIRTTTTTSYSHQ